MNNKEPIIVIEDDPDDRYLLAEIFLRINNKHRIIYFENGIQAYEYLVSSDERPFLIFSDINMPGMTGLELKEKINKNEELRLKCIPYIFFTTSSSPVDIVKAYSNSVQGFFIKPQQLGQFESTIKLIVDYWSKSILPEGYR